MNAACTPVVFANRAGLRLFGILHMPAEPRRTDVAVLLLSPGVKMRVGPGRLYCTMAERFAEMGLTVLRFDFFGLGDSEGDITEDQLKDVYNHIEVGRFVDDTMDAMDWMAREHGIRRFVLSGLCGGAITGLLAAQRDARVAGLLALSITPLLASRSADPGLYMTSGQAADLRRTYFGKLASPKAWLRLLTLRTDFAFLWRAMRTASKPGAAAQTTATAEARPPIETDNASPLFSPAFFSMVESERPILMIFGGSDRLLWEYDEKFVARHRERLALNQSMHKVHTIALANHVLSLESWQREMLACSAEWLGRHFPTPTPTPAPGA